MQISLEQKMKELTVRCWKFGKRDERLNTNYAGKFMVVENFDEEDYGLPTLDGGNGPWCIVGDDLERLIDEAYSIFCDIEEN
jgi:hypothetical protein